MALLASVSCGTYLVYSPRGTRKIDKRSRDWCYGLKGGTEERIEVVAEHISNHSGSPGVLGVLGRDAVLVPMPRSSPLIQGALWPARLLADALVARSMGECVLPLLNRIRAVPKSSTSSIGQRPTARDHFNSFEVERLIPVEDHRIVVVDDVISRGSTMLAAVSRLVGAYPELAVSGFAFVRTQSLKPIRKVLDPADCEISLRLDERGWRTP